MFSNPSPIQKIAHKDSMCVLAVLLKSNFSAQPKLCYAQLCQVQAKTIVKVKVEHFGRLRQTENRLT